MSSSATNSPVRSLGGVLVHPALLPLAAQVKFDTAPVTLDASHEPADKPPRCSAWPKARR